tara:strand:+ start:6404 stop:6694 length:291 start_codon:yes stop_codon:yes gene_type:complete
MGWFDKYFKCYSQQNYEEPEKMTEEAKLEKEIAGLKRSLLVREQMYHRVVRELQDDKRKFINEYILNRSKTHTCMDGQKEAEEALKAWKVFNNVET